MRGRFSPPRNGNTGTGPSVFSQLPAALSSPLSPPRSFLSLAYPTPRPASRSTVEGATLGLGKILGSLWALTYLALVVGNPKFQPMVDPALLHGKESGDAGAVLALAVSGGGDGGDFTGTADAGLHQDAVADAIYGDTASLAGVVAGDGAAVVTVPDAGVGVGAARSRSFGVVGAFSGWAKRRGVRRTERQRHRRRPSGAGASGELATSSGGARVAATPVLLVRTGK